jgi:hypothetical protein
LFLNLLHPVEANNAEAAMKEQGETIQRAFYEAKAAEK